MINLSVLSQFFLERWQRVSLHFDIWALFRRKKEPDQKKLWLFTQSTNTRHHSKRRKRQPKYSRRKLEIYRHENIINCVDLHPNSRAKKKQQHANIFWFCFGTWLLFEMFFLRKSKKRKFACFITSAASLARVRFRALLRCVYILHNMTITQW